MSFTERRRRTGHCEFQDSLQVPFYCTHMYVACTFLHACTKRATWLSTFNHYCMLLIFWQQQKGHISCHADLYVGVLQSSLYPDVYSLGSVCYKHAVGSEWV